MNRLLCAATVVLIGLCVCAQANPVLVSDPTWMAIPPLAPAGLPVGVIYCNTSIVITELPDTHPWHIEDGDGVHVYDGGVALTMIVDVPPGGCLGWNWGQQDNDGNQVPPATYYAVISWKYEGELTWRQAYQPIEVLGTVSIKVDPNPVEVDGTAMITLINNTPVDIDVPAVDPWWIEVDPGETPQSRGEIRWENPDVIPAGGTMDWSWVPSDSALTEGDYYIAMDVRDASSKYIRVTEHVNVMPVWPSPEVVWVVSPPVNTTGSCVAMTFTNATADTVYLPAAQHWWIEDLDGNLVFQPVTTLAIVPVPPGTTVSWAWHERDMNDQLAPAGYYVAKTEYYTDDTYTTKIEKSYYFQLVSVEPPCLFVKIDKALYSIGELVEGDFENCAPDTVGMVVSQFWWISNQIGLPVYGPYVLYVHMLYPPDTGFPIDWDQTDMTGLQVPPGTYYAWASFTDEHFITHHVQASPPFVIGAPTGIGETPVVQPRLDQNYPNPFNPGTEIRYWVSVTAPVTLRVYDAAGRLIRTLVDEVQDASPQGYTVTWDATNDAGQGVASGTYFYQLTQGGAVTAKKMVVLK